MAFTEEGRRAVGVGSASSRRNTSYAASGREGRESARRSMSATSGRGAAGRGRGRWMLLASGGLEAARGEGVELGAEEREWRAPREARRARSSTCLVEPGRRREWRPPWGAWRAGPGGARGAGAGAALK